MELTEEKREEVLQESIPPMGFRMIAREFVKEKMAMFSLILLVIILLAVFIGSLVLDQSAVMHVSILDKYAEPGTVTMNGTKFILGADEGGRDVLGQLIIGARNSILIGFAITIITSIIGVGLGIISGYYGGMIDNILMRIVDFIMILPIMLIIIVFVSVIPTAADSQSWRQPEYSWRNYPDRYSQWQRRKRAPLRRASPCARRDYCYSQRDC